MSGEILVYDDDFTRKVTFSTTPEGGYGWTIADTSTSGTPTYATIDDNSGLAKLLLDNTNEVQNVCLYHGDRLSFALANILRVEMIALVGGLASSASIAFGLGSARNDTLDSVATNAWFRLEGAGGGILCETDDGTRDVDDVATGLTLGTTRRRFEIDFQRGLSNVQFNVSDAYSLKPAARSQTFDMSAASSAKVQPLIQIQKTAATDVPYISIDRFRIEWKRSA